MIAREGRAIVAAALLGLIPGWPAATISLSQSTFFCNDTRTTEKK